MYFIFLTEYNHTSVVPPGHTMPQPPAAPFPAGSTIPAQPEITVAYALPPTQAPAYLVHGKVGGKSRISYTDRLCWYISVLPMTASLYYVVSNCWYSLCLYYVVFVLCLLCLYYVYLDTGLLDLDAGWLARSQNPEGPATGHLDPGFLGFPGS